MILSALSILANVAGLHGWFMGLKHGKLTEKILDEIVQTRSEIEKLSDHIYYASSITQVHNLSGNPSEILTDKHTINELLSPIQKSIQEEILSTAVISTPAELRAAFNKDPWEVLFSIRPISRPKKPNNPDVLPVIFMEGGSYFVGWQMKGALPSLLNCHYDPETGIYLNSEKEKQNNMFSVESHLDDNFSENTVEEDNYIHGDNFVFTSSDSSFSQTSFQKPEKNITKDSSNIGQKKRDYSHDMKAKSKKANSSYFEEVFKGLILSLLIIGMLLGGIYLISN